jgi:hypothetical protein
MSSHGSDSRDRECAVVLAKAISDTSIEAPLFARIVERRLGCEAGSLRPHRAVRRFGIGDHLAEGGQENESRAYDPYPDSVAVTFDMPPKDALLFAARDR